MEITKKFLVIFTMLFVLSLSGCHMSSKIKSERASESANPSITPAINESVNKVTYSPSITQVPNNKEFNYEWFKTKITYVREDGLKTIAFDWYKDDYVKFLFNDGFVLIKSDLKSDDVIEDALLYEITDEETIGTVDIVYHYKEDMIEVIDSEKNGYARSGYYYPEGSGYEITDNAIDYQWYEGKAYIGGQDGDMAFQMEHYDDGYFQFIFNKTFDNFGTNSISDTIMPNALVYDYNNHYKVIYYYMENKVEVIDTSWNTNPICGLYYPGDIKDANISEPPKDSPGNHFFTTEKIYVRQDGAYVFCMDMYDSGEIDFIFDNISTWSPSIIDDVSIPNAELYKNNSNEYEVIYYRDRDIIQVKDFDNFGIDYSGNYYYVKSLGTYVNEPLPTAKLKEKIDYEWYSSNKEFIREDGIHTFRMNYLENGYLGFVFDDKASSLSVHYVDDESIPNGLLYEINGPNKIYVIYYYLEDKVQVVDAIGMGYSGFYYPKK